MITELEAKALGSLTWGATPVELLLEVAPPPLFDTRNTTVNQHNFVIT